MLVRGGSGERGRRRAEPAVPDTVRNYRWRRPGTAHRGRIAMTTLVAHGGWGELRTPVRWRGAGKEDRGHAYR